MRPFRNTVRWGVALAIAASACAQQEKAAITLERTACFGMCPVYSLRIDSSETVAYEGKEYGSNPRVVQGAVMSASRSNAGRRE